MSKFDTDDHGNCSRCGGIHYGDRYCPLDQPAAADADGEPSADVAEVLLKQTISDWLADGEPHPEAEVMHHVWSMLHGASIYIAALESAIRELQADKDNMMEAALKIRSQRERAESLLHDDQRIIGEVMDRALRAEAERDAAIKDAERYRYLRSWQGQWIIVREEPEDTQLHGDVLDAAIDAALARAGEKP